MSFKDNPRSSRQEPELKQAFTTQTLSLVSDHPLRPFFLCSFPSQPAKDLSAHHKELCISPTVFIHQLLYLFNNTSNTRNSILPQIATQCIS